MVCVFLLFGLASAATLYISSTNQVFPLLDPKLSSLKREKRVVVFRPLFVYRDEQVKKIRLRNDNVNDVSYADQQQGQQLDAQQIYEEQQKEYQQQLDLYNQQLAQYNQQIQHQQQHQY